MFKPICDVIPLTESVNDSSITKVSGIFSQCDKLNKNGRRYTRNLWERILSNPKIQEQLANRQMVGELGHPIEEERIETLPERISHVVTSLKLMPDGRVIGEAEILDTPMGKILKTLYEAGVKIGISSRGYTQTESYSEEVPDDYELVTFDFVLDPSSQEAYPIKEQYRKPFRKALTEAKSKIGNDLYSYLEGFAPSEEEKEVDFPVNEPDNTEISLEITNTPKNTMASISIKDGDIEKLYGRLCSEFNKIFDLTLNENLSISVYPKEDSEDTLIDFIELKNFLNSIDFIELDEFIITYGGKVTVIENKKPVLREEAVIVSDIDCVPRVKLEAAIALAEDLADYARTAEDIIAQLRVTIAGLEAELAEANTTAQVAKSDYEELNAKCSSDKEAFDDINAKYLSTCDELEDSNQRLTLACDLIEELRNLYNNSEKENGELSAKLTSVSESVKKFSISDSRKRSQYPSKNRPVAKFEESVEDKKFDYSSSLSSIVERMFSGK